MPKLEEIEKQVLSAFEKVDDPETLKKIGSIKQLFQEKEEEDAKLIEAHKKLVDDYREAIMNTGTKPLNTADEKGTVSKQAPSFDSIIQDIIKKG